MDSLLQGYARFRANRWAGQRKIFEELAEHGQKPRAIVLACCDSRCDPAMVFDSGPGELFVIRNVANLVPPYAPDNASHGTSAALEFGVRALEIPHLAVMGHAMCGGIAALMNGTPDTCPDFIRPWMQVAERARQRVLACDDPLRAAEYETVRVSLENLMGFPWIADRVARGKLQLHGMLFDIRTGKLEILEKGQFREA